MESDERNSIYFAYLVKLVLTFNLAKRSPDVVLTRHCQATSDYNTPVSTTSVVVLQLSDCQPPSQTRRLLSANSGLTGSEMKVQKSSNQ